MKGRLSTCHQQRRDPSAKALDRWELFDLDQDLGEIHDLATQQAEKLKELLKIWDQYVVETGVVPLNPSAGEFIAATEAERWMYGV